VVREEGMMGFAYGRADVRVEGEEGKE